MNPQKKITILKISNIILFIFIIIIILYFNKIISIERYKEKSRKADLTSNKNMSQKNLDIALKAIITKNKPFYEKLNTYLNSTDSLDLSYGDTINFESKQDIYFMSETPFIVTPDRKYVICGAYPSKFVAIFSKNGELIKKLGKEGEGPGEYKSSDFVDLKGDTIYIYDGSLRKVILYSLDGHYIGQYQVMTGGVFPNDFKISRERDIAIFYNLFALNEDYIISLASFDRNTHSLHEIGRFGKMSEVSRVSSYFAIRGLAIIENGYISALDPQRFGFHLFRPDGTEMASFFPNPPRFFKPLKSIRKGNLRNQKKMTALYFKHSRCYSIHYLGRGIIGILVECPMKKADKRIPFYYSLWRVDGKYLGALKVRERIIKGESGKLYYWIEEIEKSEKNAEGFYKNPPLVVINLW